jgi:glycosyltransferase involved in cell wall biosynthesis
MQYKKSSAKVIYFAHDLHFLRMERQYAIERIDGLMEDARKMRETEFAIINTVDITHVVGEFEVNYLKTRFPHKKIEEIPLFLFDISERQNRQKSDRRDNILFVGGFSHSPNVDAVKWFIENVWKAISKDLSMARFRICGSNPPAFLRNYVHLGIDLIGEVTDKELEEEYTTSRLMVVPLRFGAGVKGKVLEAMYYGLPTMATSIAAEGIHDAENALVVVNTVEEWRTEIIELYTNEAKRRTLAVKGRDVIARNYTKNIAKEILQGDLLTMG